MPAVPWEALETQQSGALEETKLGITVHTTQHGQEPWKEGTRLSDALD